MSYATQRTVAAARIRDCTIIDSSPNRFVKTDKVPMWCRLSPREYMLVHTGEKSMASYTSRKCNIRIRHLILDEGTPNERHVWDGQMFGALL